MRANWNHNTHYHRFILSAMPRPCRRALDLGCGQGLLTQQLASRCDWVTGIDFDPHVLATAKPQPSNVELIQADAMTYPFRPATFDCLVSVATLHHLPLEAGLARFASLLRPGGTLIFVGLYRLSTPSDYVLAAIAKPISLLLRRRRGFAQVDAPIQPPKETLAEIREAVSAILPGSTLRRRFFFRYTVRWRKPLS